MESRSNLARIGIGVAMLALVALVFAHAMTAPVNRDESMYVGAGVLARSASVYADFPFLQAPGLAWLYAAVLPAPGEGPLLLVGRWVSVACAAVIVVAVVATVRRRRASPWGGLGLAALLALQPVFLESAGEASNHLPPLAAFAIATWLLADPERRPRWTLVLAGVALGTAVALRLTWAIVLVATVVATTVTSTRRPRGPVAEGSWVFLGAAVALVPVLVVALADPHAFVFQTVDYHLVNRAWAIANEPWWSTGRSAFPRALGGMLLEPATIGLLLGVAAIVAVRGMRAVGFAIVLAGTVLAAAVPSPWWPKHVLPFVGGLAVLTAAYVRIDRARAVVLGLAVAITVLGGLASHRVAVRTATSASDWTPMRVHREAAALADAEVDGAVATLAPLLALEAGLTIDAGSVAGPFLHRVRDRLDAESIAAASGGHRVLDPDRRPAAFLLDVEPQFEGDVADRLPAAGYSIAITTSDGATLWVRDDDR